MRRNLVTLTVGFCGSLFVCGCTTTSSGPEYKTSQVVERMGGKEATPDWATGEISTAQEGSDIIYVATMDMSGDTRPEACIQIAREKARASIVRNIWDKVKTENLLEDNIPQSDPDYQSAISSASHQKLIGVGDRQGYWERYLKSNASGQRELRVRCAAKVGIAKGKVLELIHREYSKKRKNDKQKDLEPNTNKPDGDGSTDGAIDKKTPDEGGQPKEGESE